MSEEKKFPPRLFGMHHKISNGEEYWTAKSKLGMPYDSSFKIKYLSLEEHNALLAAKDTELAAMERRARTFQAASIKHGESLRDLEAEYAALEKKLKEADDDMCIYGSHDKGCFESGPGECDCGFSNALAKLRGENVRTLEIAINTLSPGEEL